MTHIDDNVNAAIVESVEIKNWSSFDNTDVSFGRDYRKLPYCCSKASRPLRADDVIGLIFQARGKFPVEMKADDRRDFSDKGKALLKALPPKPHFFDQHAEEHFFKIVSIEDDRSLLLKPVFIDKEHNVIHKWNTIEEPAKINVPKDAFDLGDCFCDFIFGDDEKGFGTVRTDAHKFGDLRKLVEKLQDAWRAALKNASASAAADPTREVVQAYKLFTSAEMYWIPDFDKGDENISDDHLCWASDSSWIGRMRRWISDPNSVQRQALRIALSEEQVANLARHLELAARGKEMKAAAMTRYAAGLPENHSFDDIEHVFHQFCRGNNAVSFGASREDYKFVFPKTIEHMSTCWRKLNNASGIVTTASISSLKEEVAKFVSFEQFEYDEKRSRKYIEKIATMKAWLDDMDSPERALLLSVCDGEGQLAQLRTAFEAAEKSKEVYGHALANFIDGLPDIIENVDIVYSGSVDPKMAPPLIDPRKVLAVVDAETGVLKLSDEKDVWRVYTDDGNAPRRSEESANDVKKQQDKAEDGNNDGEKEEKEEDDEESDSENRYKTERMTLCGDTTTWGGNLLSQTMEEKEELIKHLGVGNIVRVMFQNSAPYLHILKRLDDHRCLAQIFEVYLSNYGDTVLVIDLRAVSEIPLEWSGNENLVEKLRPLQRSEGYAVTGFRQDNSAEHVDFTYDGLRFE